MPSTALLHPVRTLRAKYAAEHAARLAEVRVIAYRANGVTVRLVESVDSK